ncbi:nitrate ABC transporter substrate-binding protein [Cellulosimicrobium arenosum]|uniref:Nitrate ABC transporter substrate-binding protein n=1 Tax=Cellulosimicrobium arenosum TaxID=2708133 RepID=A0A927IYX7_9MICO|nr:nitrate ABC transporter substrate-binding protein [Cellulosimicrobium arenosum]MBD8078876.1 nitrate ABC transporter substrate-binding protein [Cellulosimicrobium arenosum]
MTTHRTALVPVLAVLSAAALAGCAGGTTSGAPDAAGAAGDRDGVLVGQCPDEVVVQLQWQPQSDQGAVFGLLGEGWTVDAEQHSVTGPLVAGGEDTGVDVTLRAGGPAIGFQSVPSQMYVDDAITVGLVHGDQLVAAAAEAPVVGVAPLLRYSPAILMWDPESHPEIESVEDVHASGAPVVVSADQIYPAWMVAHGLLDADQVDTSYDGNPARFVGDPTIVQQGFGNSEPYTYESETPAWAKPVGFAYIKDAGYDAYASNVSVRADRVDELSPCLDLLVPMIQQANVDYAASPDAVNDIIVGVVEQDAGYSPYSAGEAAYSARTLVDEGLIAPEEDGSVSTYDLARVDAFVTDLVGVLEGEGTDLGGVTADELFTDEYTDHAVTMG